MLKGALFGAIAGLTAGASLAHAMAYPVGNNYHTYHGETIAALTPASTLGYNVASDPPRFAKVAEMLGADLRDEHPRGPPTRPARSSCGSNGTSTCSRAGSTSWRGSPSTTPARSPKAPSRASSGYFGVTRDP